MSDTHVRLEGSRRPPPQGAIRLRNVDAHAQINLTITLEGPKLPNIDEMPKTAMSREQIAKTLGVPAETIQKVRQALGAYGLQVKDVKQGGRSLRVSGSAAAIEAAFMPNLGIYQAPGEGQIRAREGELMIPKELAGIVSGVYNLDQRRMARRRARDHGRRTHETQAAAQASAADPLTPKDLEARYNFPAGDGAGQTIAICEFGQDLGNGQTLPPAYIPADVTSYCSNFGLNVPTVRIESVGMSPLNQNQYETLLGQLPKDLQNLLFQQTAETMMDVQIVAGLCPNADIGVYFASWGEGGWIDILDEVTSGAGKVPVVVSISYGLAEEAPDWSNGAMTEINKRLQIAAMQGITICVSSGDDGTGCGQTGNRCHVEFPSSSPFVLSVGGTMLTTDAGGSTQEEVWWESPGERTPRGGGSTGSGVSTLNNRPPWQTVQVQSLNPGAIDGRVLPDVSALAGPPLYFLFLDGRPLPDGGTSASTPLWAALIARINGALAPAKRQRFLPPLLYQNHVGVEGFHDITVGQNASHPNPGIGYQAGNGFDAVSGWGVPNGKALLASL